MLNSNAKIVDRIEKGIRITMVGILTNMFLAAIKIVTGIFGHSYALVADGIESLLDIFSSTIVLSGLTIGAIPADNDHPFGHGKAESLAAMVVSLVLIGVAVGIAYKSVCEIFVPHHIPARFTLIVLAGVIIIKEVLFRFVFKVGKSVDSLSLKVDAWHHRSDALTSVAAFIGISIALIGGKGYESADDWAALFASGVIAFNGCRLLKFAINEIMDAAPPPEIEKTIRQAARQVNEVIAVEKCRVRKSGLGYFVDIHVEVDGDLPVRLGHTIAHQVKDALLGTDIGVIDASVHIEPPKSELK